MDQGRSLFFHSSSLATPAEKYETRAYFSTDQLQNPVEIVSDFVKRWNMEVTFEVGRAHLGVETQRQ